MCHPCPGCAQAPGSPCTHSTSLPGASNHKTSFLTFLPQAYFPQQAFLTKAASPSLTRCIGGSRAGRGHKRVCLAARSWPEVMIQGLTLPAPPPESRSSSSTHGAPHHQHTDLSGLVGSLSAAIKLCQNGKASLYKPRSKPSIFYDRGHSLI